MPVRETDFLYISKWWWEWAGNGKEYAHSVRIVLQTAEGEEVTDNDKYSYLYLQLFYGPQTGKFSYAF